jgi:hypothetical protein
MLTTLRFHIESPFCYVYLFIYVTVNNTASRSDNAVPNYVMISELDRTRLALSTSMFTHSLLIQLSSLKFRYFFPPTLLIFA